MKKTVGHGPYPVEKVEGSGGRPAVDRIRGDEEAQVRVDLTRQGVGDAPVVVPIPTGTPVSFGQVGGNRAGGPNHLIGNALQRRWNPPNQ
jgi:hypothetical protein